MTFRYLAPVLLALCAVPAAALASDSPAFDEACTNYYGADNDPDVPFGAAAEFCDCLAAEYAGRGLGNDALEFFARTYSEDLTTFMEEYPLGETWMDQSFQAEAMCKSG
ncbi:MAG: hypothetical protein KF723_05105 [Rhizobiaceae bacterium]|nr:hypothetical protein [Rhizobiaceae bacterium]